MFTGEKKNRQTVKWFGIWDYWLYVELKAEFSKCISPLDSIFFLKHLLFSCIVGRETRRKMFPFQKISSNRMQPLSWQFVWIHYSNLARLTIWCLDKIPCCVVQHQKKHKTTNQLCEKKAFGFFFFFSILHSIFFCLCFVLGKLHITPLIFKTLAITKKLLFFSFYIFKSCWLLFIFLSYLNPLLLPITGNMLDKKR